MRYEKYQLRTDEDLKIFEFLSVGEKGIIKKRIYFQSTKWKYYYNLAFGDINAETDDIDDTVVTDNAALLQEQGFTKLEYQKTLKNSTRILKYMVY